VECTLIAQELIHLQKSLTDANLIVCLRGLKAGEAKLLLDADGICNVNNLTDLILEVQKKVAQER
jgi:hypothetical protein